MAERLYILDAFSLIYQVFHAIPEMTAPNGMPTNAVFGFTRDIQVIRKDKHPDYLLVAFDGPGETFRHQLYSEYKAQRAEMPADLRPQIAMIQRILKAYRIPALSVPGVEADDIMASVAKRCNERGVECSLCTADKDVRQCVDGFSTVYDLRRNRRIDRAFVESDWGVTPEQVVDFQAMVGDSVDNVPGIRGVGPKTASDLLRRYGSLEEIYAHIDEIAGKKVKQNLYEGKAAAFQSRELVRLKTDVPLPSDWSVWRVQEPDRAALISLFAECGFHRLVDEIRAEKSSVADAHETVATWESDYRTVSDEKGLDALVTELANAEALCLKVLTTTDDPMRGEIVGYAFSTAPGKGWFIPVRGPIGEATIDPSLALDRLRPLLENAGIAKIGQNLKDDVTVLARQGVRLAGITFDTMIASYLLDPGERVHRLEQLSQRLLGHDLIKLETLIGPANRKKPQRSLDEVDVASISAHAAEAVDATLRISRLLGPPLAAAQLQDLYEQIEIPLIEVLADMKREGIRVDVDRLRALSAEFADRLLESRREIWRLAGREFNVESPSQLRVVLFDELKLPAGKRSSSGPSTDQEVLEDLSIRHPICAMILDYRKIAKLKGTYLDALADLICPATGRIHATFHQTVAATGRLSSSDPNLQNIPVRTEEGRQIRAAFLPKEGYVLLSADYSQIELRLLASLSGDETLKRAFQDGQDIHRAVAATIAGVDPSQVTKEQRRRAKAVNFGIMYGLSPYGLARQLKIEQEEAAAFIDAYFDRYPGIERFMTTVLEGARRDGFVSTMLGRRRPINGIRNTTGRTRNLPERTAINTVVQGSAADMIKKAMVQIHHRLLSEGLAARMLLQIHDELVFEAPVDETASLATLVLEEMTTALPLDNVPIEVEIGAGPNWLDLEPLMALSSR